jgi:hypothetical protein
VSLTPHSCCRHHSHVGLLFSQQEFGEALLRFKGFNRNVIRLDQELRERLFDWTTGHAGAKYRRSIVQIVSYGETHYTSLFNTSQPLSPQRRTNLRDGGTLNIEDFLDVEPGKLFPERFWKVFRTSREGCPMSYNFRTLALQLCSESYSQKVAS